MAKPAVGITVIDPGRRTRKKTINEYRQKVFHALAANLDEIRMSAANDFIIPNTTGTRHPYKAAKLQPAVDGKLTERTGNLIKMLRHKAKVPGRHWFFGTVNTVARVKKATLRTNAFRGTITVVDDFGGLQETYRAELRVDIDSSALLNEKVERSKVQHSITQRVAYQAGRDVQYRTESFIRRETKQTLAIRFKHETPGIRGPARKFLEPAANLKIRNLNYLMNEKIQRLRLS